jgi:hypothetical protein|tara:strand:+ start:73 stop:240 length:168 start_codon:yes stop_codon:yes gene_type:complete
MPEFKFSVPASLEYTVEADTEEEAHQKLVKEGGLSIERDAIIVDVSDYESAVCID